MDDVTYGGAAQGMATAKRIESDRPSEVFEGLEGYRNRLDRLEGAVQRVYETFAAVINVEPEPSGPTELRSPRMTPGTQVGSALSDANDRLDALIATLNAACGASRL